MTARWRAFDAGLAGALTVAAVVELTVGGYSPVVAAFAATVTVSLNWRRTYPLIVMVVTAGAWTVPIMVGLVPSESALTPLIALLIAVYSVARHAPARTAVIGGAVALVASVASDLRMAHPGAGDFGFTAILISWPWFAGYALRGHTVAHANLALRAELLVAERDARAREAVAQERTRIARELHDIIAHSVSVMVVQAGAAEEVLARQPDRAAAAMAAIRDAGREALVDLRRLLGLLRDRESNPSLSPVPGIGDLDTLAGQVRAAGLPVEVRVTGTPAPLPAGLDLTAFRLVQEALTNALKHAGPARAEVSVRFEADALSVTVTDDGCGPTGVDGGGHGLAGMRERVSVYGGQLDAGPGPGGGFRVSARLPLDGRP